MNCEKVSELLVAHMDGQLTSKLEGVVGSHLDTCGACRAEMGRHMFALKALENLEPIAPSSDFKMRFWKKLKDDEPVWNFFWSWLIHRPFTRGAACLGGLALSWVIGVFGGLVLFGDPHPHPDRDMSPLTSPYPANSIESIFMEDQSPLQEEL